MRNTAAGLNAINIVEDPTIALQAKRDERASIARMTQLAEADKAEHDAMMKEFEASMTQFSKLDIDPDDVNRVQQIESEQRKTVIDALRKHDGNIVQFMRSGGGKGILTQYANKVRNSKEYQDALQMGQWYRLADASIQKGEVPHDVNIGTPEEPNFIPAHEAVKLRKDGKLDFPLAWTGSYKPLHFGDLVDRLRFVVNESSQARQLTVAELRTLLSQQNQSLSHINKMVDIYEKTMFDDGLIGEDGRKRSKHALWIEGNRDLIAIDEAEKNRRAANYRAGLSAQGREKPAMMPISQIAFSPENVKPLPYEEVRSSVNGLINGNVVEMKQYATPEMWNERVFNSHVNKQTPDLVFYDDPSGMIPISLNGKATSSDVFSEDALARARENGKGVLSNTSNYKMTGMGTQHRKVSIIDNEGRQKEVILAQVKLSVPKTEISDPAIYNRDPRSVFGKEFGKQWRGQALVGSDKMQTIDVWLPLPGDVMVTMDRVEAEQRLSKAVDSRAAVEGL